MRVLYLIISNSSLIAKTVYKQCIQNGNKDISIYNFLIILTLFSKFYNWTLENSNILFIVHQLNIWIFHHILFPHSIWWLISINELLFHVFSTPQIMFQLRLFHFISGHRLLMNATIIQMNSANSEEFRQVLQRDHSCRKLISQ